VNEDQKKEKEKVQKAFGERIKELRALTGLSQFDLGVKSSVDPRQIGRIENGRVNPGLFIITLLSEGLGLELKDLMDYDNPEPFS
jgi:transcriptional regulator with XRE-family HTH domain